MFVYLVNLINKITNKLKDTFKNILIISKTTRQWVYESYILYI